MRPLRLVATFVSLALLAPLAAGAKEKSSRAVESQLTFGVQMARQGLWSEALFRFQEAQKLEPENARILSNLGVAYEATGKFDQALDAYQRALKIAPGDKDIRNNYGRFVEFYQGFKGEKKAKEGGFDWKPTASKKGPKLPQPPQSTDPNFPSDIPPSPPGDAPPPPADV
jgi:tetratricopeptide (TPR) repeat protein